MREREDVTVRTLAEHTVNVVAWSPDGTQLCSGSGDKTLRLWNAQTGECVRTLEGHTSWVRSVTWSPDGTQLCSGSEDQTLRLWDLTVLLRRLKVRRYWRILSVLVVFWRAPLRAALVRANLRMYAPPPLPAAAAAAGAAAAPAPGAPPPAGAGSKKRPRPKEKWQDGTCGRIAKHFRGNAEGR